MLTIVGLYSIPTISPEKFDERLTFTWMKKQPWEWGILLVLASTSCLTLPFRDIYSFCSLLRENDEIRKAISSHRGKGRDLIHNYQRNVNVRRGAVKVIRESRSTIDVYQQGSILPGGADAEAINFQSRQHTVGFISNTDANVNASPDHVIADATHLRANLSSNSLRNFHVPKQLERADDRIEHFPVSFEDTILSVAENITPQKRLPTSGEFDATSKRQRPNSLQSDEIAANPASRAAHVSPVTSNRHDIGSENNGASGFMVQYDPPYFDHHTEPSQGKPHSRLARKHCRTDDGLERANASTKSAFRTAQNYQQQTAGNSETSNESFFSDTNVSSAESASSEAPLSSKLPSLIDDAGTTVSMPDDSDELQNVRILGGNHRQQRVSARNEHITEEQVEGSNQVTSPMIDNISTDASSLYPPYQVSLTDATVPGISFADNQLFSHSNRDDVQGWISGWSRVFHSPLPSKALFVSETLFHNVRVYFEKSCRSMSLDDHGTLLDSNGTELQNDLCNNFDSYCFTATMFVERRSHEEFRHALSKASALVEKILQAEHPRTLASFLEVFIHLIQNGLPDVAFFLRDFIKRMSAKVTTEWHPWGQICQLLGELDSESLDQAMAQIWKCIIDTFESELGTLGRLVVSIRLDYIKRVYGSTNYLEEEWLLRDVLAQLNGIPRSPTPRVMLNLAHNLNKQGRHDEAEEMAQEVLSLLQEHDLYAKRNSERIECKKIISRSQYNQGKALVAEQTMREAIRMIVDQRGIQHPWALEFMNVLEGWLRNWGREDDANTIRREIGELIGIGEG